MAPSGPLSVSVNRIEVGSPVKWASGDFIIEPLIVAPAFVISRYSIG